MPRLSLTTHPKHHHLIQNPNQQSINSPPLGTHPGHQDQGWTAGHGAFTLTPGAATQGPPDGTPPLRRGAISPRRSLAHQSFLPTHPHLGLSSPLKSLCPAPSPLSLPPVWWPEPEFVSQPSTWSVWRTLHVPREERVFCCWAERPPDVRCVRLVQGAAEVSCFLLVRLVVAAVIESGA